MFSSLDASVFSGSNSFYESQFEEILSKITACYLLMKKDKITLENDENKIRDFLLLNYLKNNLIRKKVKLLQWHFEREVQEDHSAGRTDIKIISQNTFEEQEAYYIIECKRLDKTNTTGTSGLNGEYIKNGISRFTSKYYSSYHRVNGMIGFVVDDLKIHPNIKNINSILLNSFKHVKTSQEITKEHFITNFKYQYHSLHSDIDNNELKIYHLMYSFHENIIVP